METLVKFLMCVILLSLSAGTMAAPAPGSKCSIGETVCSSGPMTVIIDGMETIAGQFSAARDGDPERNLPAVNPQLQLGGICLFGVSSRATKLDATIREAVEEMIGDSAPTFESRIRTMETTAFDARRQGLLVHELEERSAGETASRIAALRKGTKPKDLMLSRNASGLAEDYSNLTREIHVRMSTITAERASA